MTRMHYLLDFFLLWLNNARCLHDLSEGCGNLCVPRNKLILHRLMSAGTHLGRLCSRFLSSSWVQWVFEKIFARGHNSCVCLSYFPLKWSLLSWKHGSRKVNRRWLLLWLFSNRLEDTGRYLWDKQALTIFMTDLFRYLVHLYFLISGWYRSFCLPIEDRTRIKGRYLMHLTRIFIHIDAFYA